MVSFNPTNFSVTAGNVNTVQDIAPSSSPTFVAVNTNTVTPSGGLTLGASGQSFLLQGSNASTIVAADGTNSLTLNFADPTANQVVTVPNDSGTVCLENDPSCNFQPAGNYVQLQSGTDHPQTGDIDISGQMIAGNVDATGALGATSSINGTTFNSGNVQAGTVFANSLQNTSGRSLTVTSNGGVTIGSSAGSTNIEAGPSSALHIIEATSSGDTTLAFDTPTASGKVINLPNISGEVPILQTDPSVPQIGTLNVSEIDANATSSFSNGLTIGGGPILYRLLSGSASEGAQSLSAAGCNSFDISVPGAAMGDTVTTSVDQALPGTWTLSGGGVGGGYGDGEGVRV